MDKDKIDMINKFRDELQTLFQNFSRAYDTELNVQIVISALGYCMEALYFGSEEEHRHQVSSIILSMMSPAYDNAIQQRKDMGFDK